MNCFLRFITFFSITALLSSCFAYHTGTYSSSPIENPNATLLRTATGTATVTRVFFFGGTKRTALILEAKQDLHAHYPLKQGQVLSNVIVDIQHTFYFGVVDKTTVTVSGEIVDLNPQPNIGIEEKNKTRISEQQYLPVPEEKPSTNSKLSSVLNFHKGENVLLAHNQQFLKGLITDKESDNYTVKMITLDNKVVTKTVTADQLFTADNTPASPLQIGQKIQFKKGNGKQKEGRIVGIGQKAYLVELSNTSETIWEVVDAGDIIISK